MYVCSIIREINDRSKAISYSNKQLETKKNLFPPLLEILFLSLFSAIRKPMNQYLLKSLN